MQQGMFTISIAMLLTELRLTCCLSVPRMMSQTAASHLKQTDHIISMAVLYPACKESMTEFEQLLSTAVSAVVSSRADIVMINR